MVGALGEQISADTWEKLNGEIRKQEDIKRKSDIAAAFNKGELTAILKEHPKGLEIAFLDAVEMERKMAVKSLRILGDVVSIRKHADDCVNGAEVKDILTYMSPSNG